MKSSFDFKHEDAMPDDDFYYADVVCDKCGLDFQIKVCEIEDKNFCASCTSDALTDYTSD